MQKYGMLGKYKLTTQRQICSGLGPRTLSLRV